MNSFIVPHVLPFQLVLSTLPAQHMSAYIPGHLPAQATFGTYALLFKEKQLGSRNPISLKLIKKGPVQKAPGLLLSAIDCQCSQHPFKKRLTLP